MDRQFYALVLLSLCFTGVFAYAAVSFLNTNIAASVTVNPKPVDPIEVTVWGAPASLSFGTVEGGDNSAVKTLVVTNLYTSSRTLSFNIGGLPAGYAVQIWEDIACTVPFTPVIFAPAASKTYFLVLETPDVSETESPAFTITLVA